MFRRNLFLLSSDKNASHVILRRECWDGALSDPVGAVTLELVKGNDAVAKGILQGCEMADT